MWLIDQERLMTDLRTLREVLETQNEKALLDRVIDMVKYSPSPDTTKYGFWQYVKERGVFVCSECKHEATWENKSQFCPDCGARILNFETKEERMGQLDAGLILCEAAMLAAGEGGKRNE